MSFQVQHTKPKHFFSSTRHNLGGIPKTDDVPDQSRNVTYTSHMIFGICLGRGNTPPGTFPLPPGHIHKECWIDINTLDRKTDDMLYDKLAQQYLSISKNPSHTRKPSIIFMSIDPTDKQLKEKCVSTRDNAKKHRVLFHFNGRGVIPPQSKYFYVFDEQHKHYSPITVQSLSTSLRTPTIFVFDCQSAGDLISGDSYICTDGNVVLCACSSKESLPQSDKVPFDVFTSCLTTPIQMAMLWYFQKHGLSSDQDTLMKAVMDDPTEQNSIVRQLLFILQAITETIAYNMCPKAQFLALFRDDPFLARLMQNFLLAQRIMPLYGCNPVCYPPLPPTNTHPLWSSWDRACDIVFKRHGLVVNLFRTPTVPREIPAYTTEQTQSSNLLKQTLSELSFFESHFESFNIWLRLGCREEEPPTFLPIVMHALSNRILRPNGVKLLEQFLSLGPQMVNQAIYSGIVNSALRLLKIKTDQHPLLVSMWARIVSVDYHYASDLEPYQQFFFDAVFNTSSATVRAMALFVLTRIISRAKKPQIELVITENFLNLLRIPSKLIRASALICLAETFRESVKIRNMFVALPNVGLVINQLRDQHIEVRASAIYLLNKLNLGHRMDEEASPLMKQFDLIIPELLHQCAYDGAIMVRRELLTAVQNYLRNHIYAAANLFGPTFLIMLENNSSPYQLTLPFEKINRFGQNTPAVIYQSPSIYTQQLSSSYNSSSLSQSTNASLFRDSRQPSTFVQPDPNTAMAGISYNNDNMHSFASHNTLSTSFRFETWSYRSSPADSYPSSVGFGSFGGSGMDEGSYVTDYTSSGLASARRNGSSLSQSETDTVPAPVQTEVQLDPPTSSSPMFVQLTAENCQTKDVGEAFCAAWRLHSYYCVEHFNELGLTACKFSVTFRETVLLLQRYQEHPEHSKRPILPAMHYTIIYQWLAMCWKKRCEGGYTRMNVINKKRGWLYDADTAKEQGLLFIEDEEETEKQPQDTRFESDGSVDVGISPRSVDSPVTKGKHLPSFAVPVSKSPEEDRLAASPTEDGGASSAPANPSAISSIGALSMASGSKPSTRSIVHLSGPTLDTHSPSSPIPTRVDVPVPVTPERNTEKEGGDDGPNVAMSRLRNAMQQEAFATNDSLIPRSYSPSEAVATQGRTRQTSQSFSVGQRPTDIFGTSPSTVNPRLPLGVGQNHPQALNQMRGGRGVPTSTTPGLGMAVEEKEFSVTQISSIQYYNGITHCIFHPTDNIIALGSSKRNTVGIYSVSLSPPPAANKHHSSRDKKKSEMRQATNIKSFQIPPPQIPNLGNERVKQKVADMMCQPHVRNSITSSPYAPLLTEPPTFIPQNHPRLSSLNFINSATDTRMIISTQDSAINILSFPENEPGSRLIASFFAFPRSLYGVDRPQASNGSSQRPDPIFNLSWSQPTGLLTASGTPGTFRVWDVIQEMCMCDEPTGFNTPVTVQEMDKTGWMLILGSKRMIRMFDRRMKGGRPAMSLFLDEKPLLPTYPYFAFDAPISDIVFSSTDWSITAGTESTEVAIFDVRKGYTVQQTTPILAPLAESWTAQPGSGRHSQSINTAGDSGSFGLFHTLAHTKRCGINLQTAAFAAHRTLPYVVLGAGNQVFGMTTSSSGINVMGRGLGVVPDKDTIVSTLKWHPTEKILMASYGGKIVNVYG